jgi:hypothetical protein
MMSFVSTERELFLAHFRIHGNEKTRGQKKIPQIVPKKRGQNFLFKKKTGSNLKS